MKKSCKYCGKIHDSKFDCGKKPKSRNKYTTDIQKYYRSYSWQCIAEEVKNRDKHLCQACLHKLPGTLFQYNSKQLSVHHIIPINEDDTLKEDYSNLITLCRYHHEEAEKGNISKETLRGFINENRGYKL